MTLPGLILFDLIIIAVFTLSWLLPHHFGIRGLFGAYAVVFVGSIAMAGVQLAFPDQSPGYGSRDIGGAGIMLFGMLCLGCLILPISLLALWRRAHPPTAAESEPPEPSTPSRSSSLLNPSVSVFWLWFVAVFGIIAITPWQPYGGTYHPLAATYSRYEWYDNWQQVLVVHSLIATLLGVAFATPHAVILSVRGRPETATFSVRTLLIVTGVFALICGWLRWLHAPPGVFIAALLPLGGYFATKILAGAISRRIAAGHQ